MATFYISHRSDGSIIAIYSERADADFNCPQDATIITMESDTYPEPFRKQIVNGVYVDDTEEREPLDGVPLDNPYSG